MLRLKTKRKNNMEAVQETLSAGIISENRNEVVIMASAEVSVNSMDAEMSENASINENMNAMDNGNPMDTTSMGEEVNLANCLISSASVANSPLSIMQSSPPPHSYRHSRAYRHFKNPPQPHMCIRTTNDAGEELFINVLSWTRIVIPQEPSDPIPLYGGMRVPPGSPRSPPIVFAVMANPEVLKDSGRHSKDPEERRAMIELMCDFVEAMNPGVKLVRNAVILKDRDISGELKDVWNAVQAQRDREREEQMMQQRQQQHYHNITTQQMFSRTVDSSAANNIAAMMNGQEQAVQIQTQQPQHINDNNKNNLGEDTRLPTGNNVTMLNVTNTSSFKDDLTSQGEMMQNNEKSDGGLDTKMNNDLHENPAVLDSGVAAASEPATNLYGSMMGVGEPCVSRNELVRDQHGSYGIGGAANSYSEGTENRDQIDAVSSDAHVNDLTTKMKANLQIADTNASSNANSKVNVDNLVHSHSANAKISAVQPGERLNSAEPVISTSSPAQVMTDTPKQAARDAAKTATDNSATGSADTKATANESTASTITTASNSNTTVPATTPTTKKEKLGGFLPNGCIFPRFKNHKHKDKDKDKEKEGKPKDKEKTLLNALKKSKEKRVAPSEQVSKVTKNAPVAASGTGTKGPSSHLSTPVPAPAVEPVTTSSPNSGDDSAKAASEIITAKATQYEKNCMHIEKEVQKLDLNKPDNKAVAAAAATATVSNTPATKKENNGMFMKLKISSNNNSSTAAAK